MQESVMEEVMKRLGLSPFAHVNVGGICGVTRLVQLKQMGLDFIPMDDKIRKEAENVASGRPVKNSSIFSPPEEWLLWGQCMAAMDRQCAKSGTKFKVILFEWMPFEVDALSCSPGHGTNFNQGDLGLLP